MTTRAVGYFPRLTVNAEVLSGKTCIRGTRVAIEMILANRGAGVTIDEFLQKRARLVGVGTVSCPRTGSMMSVGSNLGQDWIARVYDAENSAVHRSSVVAAIERASAELTAGALVTIEPERVRVRRLSIIPTA